MKDKFNNQLQSSEEYISEFENKMLERFGMKLYENADGYSPEEIYRLCGRDDSVATITLKRDSQGYLDFGEDLTVCFVYTPSERQKLESNVPSLIGSPYVKAKILLPGHDKSVINKLLFQGVNSRDIIQMIVLAGTKQENTYNSNEKRSSHSIDIPFELDGNGKDISWMYGVLLHFKNQGISLTPDEYAEYLAYKIVLDKNGMTEQEYNDVFNDQELIYNHDVAWNYMNWRKDANLLTDKDKKHLDFLTILR